MLFPTQNFNNDLITLEEYQYNTQLSNSVFNLSSFSFSTIVQIYNSNEDTDSWDHSFVSDSQSNSFLHPIQNHYLLNGDETIDELFHIEAKDFETHIDGLAEGVIKAIISAWSAFVEAVKEIASHVFEWIWALIQKTISVITQPFIDMIQSFVQKIGETVIIGSLIFALQVFLIIVYPILIALEIIFVVAKALLNLGRPFGISEVAALTIQTILSFALFSFGLFKTGFKTEAEKAESEPPLGWVVNWLGIALGITFTAGFITVLISAITGIYLKTKKFVFLREFQLSLALVGLIIVLFSDTIIPQQKERIRFLDVMGAILATMGTIIYGLRIIKPTPEDRLMGKGWSILRFGLALVSMLVIIFWKIPEHIDNGYWP